MNPGKTKGLVERDLTNDQSRIRSRQVEGIFRKTPFSSCLSVKDQ